MKSLPKYVAPGRIAELDLRNHPDADRIGTQPGRSWDSDITIKVFTHRKVLAQCIRMQERGGTEGKLLWRAVIPLTDGEGY